MSRWFRFYADALRNPKVLRLSDKDFRLWVKLLAVASENDGHLCEINELKTLLGMRYDHAKEGLSRLIGGGLIDPLADGYEPHGWAKFQYKSDVSTERVHKHRAKRNVSETPPETEADTEQQIAKATVVARKRASVAPHRMPADWVPGPLPPDVAELVADWPPGRLEREAAATRDYWLGQRTRRPGWDLTFHNRIRDIHDRVLRDNRDGLPARRTDLRQTSDNRGSRPNPCLDMLYAAEAEIRASENPQPDFSARPALRAIGSG